MYGTQAANKGECCSYGIDKSRAISWTVLDEPFANSKSLRRWRKDPTSQQLIRLTIEHTPQLPLGVGNRIGQDRGEIIHPLGDGAWLEQAALVVA